MHWQQEWLAAPGAVSVARRDLWRGVEAQHRVATMRLVDDLAEQAALEQLLEDSKPPLPADGRGTQGMQGIHYLLFTPFRYTSAWPSRFRRPQEPGVWYGADAPETVAAELAHWRWVFFMDSDGLRDAQLVTEHTFFLARLRGRELDITRAPWDALRAQWRHPADYSACQALAAQARGLAPPVQAIRYESARHAGGMCTAVFDPAALAMPARHVQQTWVCKTTRRRVLLSHDADSLQFDMPEGAA